MNRQRKSVTGVAHAVRDGAWCDRRTWKNRRFPRPNDIVCANGCTVLVNGDIHVKQLRANGAYGAVDGGTFVVSENRMLYVDGICGGKTSPAITVDRCVNVTIGPRSAEIMTPAVLGSRRFTITHPSTLS